MFSVCSYSELIHAPSVFQRIIVLVVLIVKLPLFGEYSTDAIARIHSVAHAWAETLQLVESDEQGTLTETQVLQIDAR